jgi:hypothetical protein
VHLKALLLICRQAVQASLVEDWGNVGLRKRDGREIQLL